MPQQLKTAMLLASAGVLIVVAFLPADDQISLDEATDRNAPGAEVGDLGFTAKLEFRIVHPEETPTFYTHSTGGGFSITEDISEPNHEHLIKIEGTLTPGDNEQGLLLRYNVEAHHADLNEGFEAVHSVSGSALMTPGQSRTLTLLGDAALQVTVTRED